MTKAKPKIFADNILRGVGISVDTFGGDVTVRGTVENLKQIEQRDGHRGKCLRDAQG